MASEREARRQEIVGKATAELDGLAARGLLMCGNAFSPLLVLKGELGPGDGTADRPGSTLLEGPDGKALKAAFARLGYAPEDWCGLATWLADGMSVEPALLREAITALDPATLVICDEAAAGAVREAYAADLANLDDFAAAMLEPGQVAEVCGMRALNLGGFEAALSDAHQKQVAWAWLKQLPPLGEPY